MASIISPKIDLAQLAERLHAIAETLRNPSTKASRAERDALCREIKAIAVKLRED